jgi:hypothetical protein
MRHWSLLLLLHAVLTLPVVAQPYTLLTPISEYSDKSFGAHLSATDEFIAVGAPNDDEVDLNAGAVYLYHKSNGSWTLDEKLFPPETGVTRFGRSVLLSEYFLAVTGYYSDQYIDELRLYVFARTANGWEQDSQLILSTIPQRTTLSMSGDVMVVGYPTWYPPSANFTGRAQGFSSSSGTWTSTGTIQPNDLGSYDFFGIDVSVDGTLSLIGSAKGSAGAAYIFNYGADGWTQQEKISPAGLNDGAGFGNTVSLSGTTAFIGAPGDDTAAEGAGAVYIFEPSGAAWVEIDRITASDAAPNRNFGRDIDLEGILLAVGSPAGPDAPGAAYLYEYSGSEWLEEAVAEEPIPGTGRLFGETVQVTESHLVVGAPAYSNTGISGEVYVFSRTPVANESTGSLSNFNLSVAPNPATTVATARFMLAEASSISVSVHDILGRTVLIVPPATLAPGTHSLPLQVESLPSGLYFLQLRAGDLNIRKPFSRINR